MQQSNDYGFIDFRLRSPLRPWNGDPDPYVVRVMGDARLMWIDGDDTEIARHAVKLEARYVLCDSAIDDGVSLDLVFDGSSLELADLYPLVFTRKGELRKTCGADLTGTYNLLVVTKLKLNPRFRVVDLAARTLVTLARAFPTAGVIASADLPLSRIQWRELRFKPLGPDADYLVRKSSDRWPYD